MLEYEITIEDLTNWLCEELGVEIWKDIRGYEGLYQVSNGGRVRSLPRKGVRTSRILIPGKHKKGYLYVGLTCNGVRKMHKVHRLVAEAFIPNPHNYPQVNHLDEVKTSNNAANLEWCTNEYNCAYGTGRVRAQKSNSKTPIEQYTLEGVFVKRWVSSREIERELGISHSRVSKCCSGKPSKDSYGNYYRYRSAGGFIWRYAETSNTL